jgi:hypothetical protein
MTGKVADVVVIYGSLLAWTIIAPVVELARLVTRCEL